MTAIGVTLSLWSRYLDYEDTIALGIKPDIWLLIGLGVFFLSVVLMLTKFQRQLSKQSREKLPEKETKSEKRGVSISNSYATGNVTAGKGSSNVGGLIGGINTGQSVDRKALLTQEQLATRLAFVRRSKAVAEQYSQSVQDSCSVSLIRFFTDISKENRVSERRQDDRLLDQSMRLVKYDLDDLSNRVSVYKSNVLTFDAKVSDEQIRTTCNESIKMFHEVTRLMKETFVIFGDLGMKGNIPVWEKGWQNRIKSDLGATYDELIRLLKDMRSDTPQQFENLIPNNSTFVSFANTFQIPWEKN